MATKKSPAKLKSEFSKIKPISIDYGIMEKADKLLCLPASFDWADIGHWRTVQEILAAKKSDNVVKGKYIHLDGRGNLVYSYSNKLIATLGVKNSIIIETKDAILVCPKSRAQDVKKIVERLRDEGLTSYL
jgi:mannose-1-phosphate guanylyltransferase